jgi:hypothetical protein
LLQVDLQQQKTNHFNKKGTRYNKKQCVCINQKVINNIVSYQIDWQQKSSTISIIDTSNYNKKLTFVAASR